MKEYFLTEEQYCTNNIVPLTLRFRVKKPLNGQAA